MGGEIAARRFTPSREALQAYMQARHLWNLRGADNLEKATRLFQQATALQPDYASAYSGLASCYLLLPEYAMKPLQDYLPQLHAAARRAQELDPKSPEALAVLAMVSECERDYETSGRLFREALTYNPNFATARLWYGIMLREQGRLAEAEVELSRAAELDPLSAVVKANLVTLHTYRRDLDRARKDCEAALELFPNAVFLHAQLASVLLLQARWEEAMVPIQRVRSLAPDSSNGLDLLARVLVAKGDEAGARKILAELEDWKRKGYTVYPQIAMVHIALQEYPQAVAAANRALDDRQMLSGLLDDPALDPVRNQPGFAELVQRAGLQSPSLSQALNQPGGTLKTSPVLRAN
jgi:tetratricopeptide (TPR) repeat protein